MKTSCKIYKTGKWGFLLLVYFIILQRLLAGSSDSCKNLFATWKATNLVGKTSKIDYYKQHMAIKQRNSTKTNMKNGVQEEWDWKKGQMEQGFVHSISDKILLSLVTAIRKPNTSTKLNFNEKSCAKIFLFAINFD